MIEMCGDPPDRLETPILLTTEGVPVCHKCGESHFNKTDYVGEVTCKKCGERYDTIHHLNFGGKFVGFTDLKNYS